jgi:hypothetical protein
MLTESQLEWCRENIKTPAHPNLFRDMEAIANANRLKRNLGEVLLLKIQSLIWKILTNKECIGVIF